MNEYSIHTTSGAHLIQDARSYTEIVNEIMASGMLITKPAGAGTGMKVTFFRAHVVAIIGK